MVSRNQKWPKLPVFEDDGFVDMTEQDADKVFVLCGVGEPYDLVVQQGPRVLAAHMRVNGGYWDTLGQSGLKHALALMDCKVLDRIVVGGTSAVSFADRGWL